jgi:beta-1,4-mannosyl-glycoprotein beta-1,4-N-acetylglucosaminyltransferase
MSDKNDCKIIDCFTFYNELELLSYRLNILNDVVDYFIIVEATHTHAGNKKTLYFQENKHLFETFRHKIIHVIVDDFKYIYPSINYHIDEQWNNEKYQRNCISIGISRIELNDNDVITITDLDEIPDSNTLSKIKDGTISVEVNVLEMDLYYYNLNCRYDMKWNHAKIVTYKKYKELNISCNKIRFLNVPVIHQGGWHLSYFGTPQFISNKIKEFSHQEYNSEQYTDITCIEEKIKTGADLYNRNYINPKQISIVDNTYLPLQYDKYLQGSWMF